MLIELTQAIHKTLKDNGLDVIEYGYKDLIDRTLNLKRPAVNVTINRASVEKVTMSKYKWVLRVSCLVVISNLAGGWLGEAKRKEGVYKLLEGITDHLFLQKLGLELQNPLFPEEFRNITDRAQEMAGYQIYEIAFWCSYIFNYTEPQDVDNGELKSIYSKYFLEPPDSTSVVSTTVLSDSTVSLI